MCVCCVAAWPEPCASKEQVWGGSPALPVAHLRGRLCAACALSVPTPHRAGEPGGERGVRRGERGLKGINHGREKRAGGRRMEGGWLAAHVYPPPLSLLPLPCFFYLLSVPMLMSCDVQGRDPQGGRETQKGEKSTLLVLRVETQNPLIVLKATLSENKRPDLQFSSLHR